MPLYEALLRPLLFLLDPETAHNLALRAVRAGLARAKPPRTDLEKTLFGVSFPNPVGLAAGFDKDAVAPERWKNLGFGFVEVGLQACERAEPAHGKIHHRPDPAGGQTVDDIN